MIKLSEVEKQLNKLDNGFPPQIIKEVFNFLQEHIGQLYNQNPKYHIAAAAAIVSQCSQIPTVGDTGHSVSSGIKIENVMKRLKDLSKDTFLDTINLQLEKYATSQHHLKEKIPKIRVAYRSFKKYKAIFSELCTLAHIPQNIVSDLESFFWIVFLLIKIKSSMIQDLSESMKILIVILERVFTVYIGNLSIKTVDSVIYRQQNFGAAQEITESQAIAYEEKVLNEIREVYSVRASNIENCFKILLSDDILLSRLVDDLGQLYDKEFYKLPDGRFIDEITFLGLIKNLTPQAVKRTQVVSEPISQVINFFSENEDDSSTNDNKQPMHGENDAQFQPINRPPQPNRFSRPMSMNIGGNNTKMGAPKKNEVLMLTPFTRGIVKSSWVNEKIKQIKQAQEQFAGYILQIKGFQRERVNMYIVQCIKQMIPHCLKQQQTKEQIWKLFVFFIRSLHQVQEPQNLMLEYLHQTLCLSACVYIYTKREMKLELNNYCKVFETDIIRCCEIIFFVISKLKLQKIITEYLYELERSVLIKELWDTELGYNFLNNEGLKINTLISRRFSWHIKKRIEEICKKIRAEKELQSKILSLVLQIMKEKYQLLEGNRLDQIIICAITLCLKVNECRHPLAISHIFEHYNKSSFSFHSNKDVLNFKEGKMSLMDFYNYIFLVEVEDMMKSTNKANFIYTPIREQHLKRVVNRVDFPPASPLGGNQNFSKAIEMKGENSFVKKLKAKARNQIQNDMVDEEDEAESPRFGSPRLQRTYTFGGSPS